MNSGMNVRVAKVLAPISLSGGATATTTEVDTVNVGVKYNQATVYIMSGLVGANGVSTLKVQEGDTSGGSYTDITGASFTALADADDNIIVACDIDLRKRKRYLNVVITNGATNASVMCAWCELTRAEETPSSKTQRGVQELL